MIRPGIIAWADATPGFRPPGRHPIIVLRSWPNGNVGVAYITHSYEGAVSYPFTRPMYPGAFRENGGPLLDDRGRILLRDRHGDRILIAQPTGPESLSVGSATIRLSSMVLIPPAIWSPLIKEIRGVWEQADSQRHR